jgi:hypothetical protein
MLRSRTGGARFGCLLAVVAIALMWGGGQGVYTSMKNRRPSSMTIAEFLHKRSDAEWLELRDAVVHLPGAGHIYNRGNDRAPATELYIPLYATEPAHDSVPTRVVLQTSDSTLVDLYNRVAQLSPDSAGVAWFDANHDRLSARRTVKGLVQFGIDADSHEQELLQSRVARTTDFIVLKDGEEPPGAVVSIVMIVIGLALLLFGGALLAKE